MMYAESRQSGRLAGTVTRMVGVPALFMVLLLAGLLLVMQPQRDPAALLRRKYIPPAPTPGGMAQRQFTLTGMLGEGVLTNVEWSPDGRWLALQKADAVEIYAYDAEREALGALHLAITLQNTETQMRFSPDGGWLALSNANELTVWRVEDGAPALTHGQRVDTTPQYIPFPLLHPVAFTRDGQYILHHDTNNREELIVSALRSGQMVNRLRPALDGEVIDFTLSPDGTRLMVIGRQAQVIYDDPTGRWERLPDNPTRLSLDLVALVGGQSQRPSSGFPPGVVPIPTPVPGYMGAAGSGYTPGWLQAVTTFNKAGTQVALLIQSQITPDSQLLLLDALTGEMTWQAEVSSFNLPFTPNIPSCFTGERVSPRLWFTADEGSIMTYAGGLCRWDVLTGRRRQLFSLATDIGSQHFTASYFSSGRLAAAPSMTQAAFIHYDGLLYLLDTQTGQKLHRIGPDTSLHVMHQMAFSPDGRSLVSSSSDVNVRLWTLDDPAPPPRILSHTLAADNVFGGMPFLNVQFSRDGTRVLIHNPNYLMQAIDLATGVAQDIHLLGQIIPPQTPRPGLGLPSIAPINALDMENKVAISFNGRQYSILNPDGTPRPLYHRHVRQYSPVHALSPDGKRLAVVFNRQRPLGQLRRGIVIFDMATGAGYVLPGTQDDIQYLLFTPDGSRLITVNPLGTLRFHQVDNGEISLTIPFEDARLRFSNLWLSGDGSVVMLQQFFHDSARTTRFDLTLYSTLNGEMIGRSEFSNQARPFWAGRQIMALNHDGSQIAVADVPGRIRLYELR